MDNREALKLKGASAAADCELCGPRGARDIEKVGVQHRGRVQRRSGGRNGERALVPRDAPSFGPVLDLVKEQVARAPHLAQ